MAAGPTDNRRLATILSLDVAGYSRAAERDDAAAAAGVRQLRAVITEIVTPCNGRIFKTAGDGFMIEFPSAASGVQAAMALLQESRSGARPLPNIRIGVHLGDVIVEENGDLLGHGVNVAARLQALAEPGTAMVSETVWEQVRSAAELPFRSQGRVQLDKMAQRLEVYSLDPANGRRMGKVGRRRLARLGAVAAALLLAATAGYAAWRVWSPHAAPRIAVLRFVNIGDTRVSFAEEAGEELITELAQIRGLEVTSRLSSFALTGDRATPANAASDLGATLVLTGSVRRLEDGAVRVQAQLVEAPGGRQIWAEAFEQPAANVFALQRDIALSVARAVNLQMEPTPKKAVDPQAYSLYLQGLELLAANKQGDTAAMRDLFRSAVDRDPTFGAAWNRLAYAENDMAQSAIMNGPPDTPITDAMFRPAIDAADKAIALEGKTSSAVGLKAIMYTFLGRWKEAAEMNAVSEQTGRDGDFCVPYYLGYETQALRYARQATRDDPLNPRSWQYVEQSCRLAGDRSCQVEGAKRSRELAPNEPGRLGYLFYALAEAQQVEAARRVQSSNAAQLKEFYEVNNPVDERYFKWMTGDGPPAPAAEIVNAVKAGTAYVDPAVEILTHMKEWETAARMLDDWGQAARPSLPYLYTRELAPLRKMPQFWALMDREGLTTYWRSSGLWPDFCKREPVCDAHKRADPNVPAG